MDVADWIAVFGAVGLSALIGFIIWLKQKDTK